MANGTDPYNLIASAVHKYSTQAAQMAFSYPWYTFYPTLIAARHCRDLTLLAPKREPHPIHWPKISSLQAAFFSRAFIIWAAIQLFQGLLIFLIENDPPTFFMSFSFTVLFAPFNLAWMWSVTSRDHMPLEKLVRSLVSVRLSSWVQYITALIASHSARVLLPSVIALGLSIGGIHDGIELDSFASLFKQFIYLEAQSKAEFIIWVLTTVATTQAALLIPCQEMKLPHRDERGFWSTIYNSIASINFSLWGRFILNSWFGMVAVWFIMGISTCFFFTFLFVEEDHVSLLL